MPARRMAPASAPVLRSVGVLLGLRGDANMGRVFLQQALRLQPDYAEAQQALAELG